MATSKITDHTSKLATKEQLDMHIQQLENKLDMSIQQLENKLDMSIQQLENKFDNKFELADKRFESIEKNMATKEDLHKLEATLLKWMIPLFLSIIGMFGTVIFKLFVA